MQALAEIHCNGHIGADRSAHGRHIAHIVCQCQAHPQVDVAVALGHKGSGLLGHLMRWHDAQVRSAQRDALAQGPADQLDHRLPAGAAHPVVAGQVDGGVRIQMPFGHAVHAQMDFFQVVRVQADQRRCNVRLHHLANGRLKFLKARVVLRAGGGLAHAHLTVVGSHHRHHRCGDGFLRHRRDVGDAHGRLDRMCCDGNNFHGLSMAWGLYGKPCAG